MSGCHLLLLSHCVSEMGLAESGYALDCVCQFVYHNKDILNNVGFFIPVPAKIIQPVLTVLFKDVAPLSTGFFK